MLGRNAIGKCVMMEFLDDSMLYCPYNFQGALKVAITTMQDAALLWFAYWATRQKKANVPLGTRHDFLNATVILASRAPIKSGHLVGYLPVRP